MHAQEMYRRLAGLVVFRQLLQDPVVAACGEMLSARVRGDCGDFSAACAGFEAALFQSSDSWSRYLREAVLESENVCIRGQAVGSTPALRESLRREQLLTEEIGQLESQARRVTRAISGMPGGGGDGQAIPRAVERLEETRQKLAGLLEQDQAQRAEIESAIQKEPIPLRRDILTRRYILGQRWEKIAAAHHLVVRQVFRLHHQAVDGLDL